MFLSDRKPSEHRSNAPGQLARSGEGPVSPGVWPALGKHQGAMPTNQEIHQKADRGAGSPPQSHKSMTKCRRLPHQAEKALACLPKLKSTCFHQATSDLLSHSQRELPRNSSYLRTNPQLAGLPGPKPVELNYRVLCLGFCNFEQPKGFGQPMRKPPAFYDKKLETSSQNDTKNIPKNNPSSKHPRVWSHRHLRPPALDSCKYLGTSYKCSTYIVDVAASFPHINVPLKWTNLEPAPRK